MICKTHHTTVISTATSTSKHREKIGNNISELCKTNSFVPIANNRLEFQTLLNSFAKIY